MGRVNIIGLGQVDIEGDTPNEQEIEVFKRMAAVKGADKTCRLDQQKRQQTVF
jgi:hypothetical protein